MSVRKSPASAKAAGPSPSSTWLVRTATTAGRPAVLTAALALSAPGEYRLALLAGWTPSFAAVMPLVMSLYAGVAAAIASSLTKGSPERRQANAGAVLALLLAMTAQVIAHLIEAGYLVKGPAVVVAVSAVPPLVAAHTLHLAGVTVTRPVISPEPVPPTVNLSRTSDPPWKPAVIKAMPALPPPTVKPVKAVLTPRPEVVTARVSPEPEEAAQSTQKPSADRIVRGLYDQLGGKRPTTGRIRDALKAAGLPCSDGTARSVRLRVERDEPALRLLPPA
ncbi:hypothetical protein OH738_10700 [Streptomyces hirsutus]|uniref:DUF2637 domain-containing protein n=1 Tax=Streptomyces hirsutus TaxID=35620 RepID=A0ABZ1GT20_9ACTN|nr:hypothetical protein [Streptomyces hirsutus]WSD09342.1 hypothetical protein OIE73_28775 [Streptomyces hirsutus]WTD17208.1 hypothetical protein OH738_10700 [Streptomyces hirsutus]